MTLQVICHWLSRTLIILRLLVSRRLIRTIDKFDIVSEDKRRHFPARPSLAPLLPPLAGHHEGGSQGPETRNETSIMSRTAPSETSLTWRGRHRRALGRCWACWWRAGACWGRGRTGRPRPACSCPAAPCAWRRCGRGCRCRARPGPTPARPSGPPASAAAASASPSALQPRQLAETPAPQEDTCTNVVFKLLSNKLF